MSDGSGKLVADPWRRLRQVTPARIAPGRAGGSLPTGELLDFQLAHALARDAVHEGFDPVALEREVAGLGCPVVHLKSGAGDRETYLLRPDLGRRLSEDRLAEATLPGGDGVGTRISIVLSDGLSALAARRQIPSLLAQLVPLLRGAGFELAPIAIVPFARVAIQDEVGALLGARPGLGSPDSLGAYLVFEPRPGRTDADRNCVSNIRPGGLPPEAAAEVIFYLASEALRRRLSGVGLKDDRDPRALG